MHRRTARAERRAIENYSGIIGRFGERFPHCLVRQLDGQQVMPRGNLTMSDVPLPEESIFLEALECPSDSVRSAYLDRACGGDRQLRDAVETLLHAHFQSGDMLDLTNAASAADRGPALERLGTQIGPYQLVAKIGEGGMGIVFRAEQQQPVKRTVALKIIKPGLDSQQVIARFEAERQALAIMDHPNIAKVLDAGTTADGRPYFVMELVDGIPITEFCDRQHLTTRERLALFMVICQAVHHAHQKGIIHRDLKPSNVLVAYYDDVAVPKVIDFGVAKAIGSKLTERALSTGLGVIVGTIEYMSPEQAHGSPWDIDTRSDVYALGVVLYELLTGDTPFDRQRLRSAALDELLRIIREEEPPKPSTKISHSDCLPSVAANRQIEPAKLSALLQGELDWIVMKALEKDRTRRYETPSALGRDVQRYLDDEPVEACPPSAVYRLGKLLRRNKVAVIATVVVLVALLAGTAISLWQAVVANAARHAADNALVESEQHRREAEANLQIAAEAVGHFVRDVGEEQAAHGKVEHGEQLLDSAIDFYARLLPQHSALPLRFQAGMAYRQAAFAHSLAGHHEQATPAARRAVDILQELAREEPDNATFQNGLAECYNDLGNVLHSQYQFADAAVMYRQALAGYDALCARFPQHAEYQFARSDPFCNLATIAWQQDQLADAEEDYRRALAIEDAAPQTLREQRLNVMRHASTLANFGMVLRERGKFAESQRFLEEAIRLEHQVLASHPNLERARNDLYHALWSLVYLLELQGKLSETNEAVEQLVAHFPYRMQAHLEAAEALLNCADLTRLEADGASRAAVYDQRAKAQLAEALHAPETTPETIERLAWFLATCDPASHRDPPQALRLARQLTQQMPQDAGVQLTLGVACCRAEAWSEAVATLTECVRQGLSSRTWEPWRENAAAVGWFVLAMAHEHNGSHAAARQAYDSGVQWMNEHPDRGPPLALLRSEAAEVLGLGENEKMPETQEKASE
jgi:eukaryotic-like serine/threonine-protein kinase